MDRFERILEDCLERLACGKASLEDCLRDHPEFAEELRPLLQAASRMKRGADVQPSPEFKQRGRARLMAHLRAHPRRPVPARTRGLLPAYRLAVGLTVLALAVFVTGTAFAQSAMPGDPLYGWKLASESAWRAVSPDPVGTDLALAERRLQEFLAVSGSERDIALQGYLEVLARLTSQTDPATQGRIILALAAQRERLVQTGISVPELDEYLSSPPVPTPLPLPPIQTPTLPGLTITLTAPLNVPTFEVPTMLGTLVP
ncbi:MAG: hypothetical protein AB1345_09385 [Chloroflexota bacterium]